MANTTWSTTDKVAGITLSAGNLTATLSSGTGGVRTIDKQIAGKFYWEVTLVSISGTADSVGAFDPSMPIANSSVGSFLVGLGSSFGVGGMNAGTIWVNGVSIGLSLGVRANGDVLCFAVDLNARLGWVRAGAAGNWNGTAGANPATGAGGFSHTFGGGEALYPTCYSNTTTHAFTANFGDTAFTGAVPAGFTAGFTAGVTSPNNAFATQLAAEQWITTNPDAQVTQIALEHWASVIGGDQQALVTQIALEQWASVASVSATQSRVWILA